MIKEKIQSLSEDYISNCFNILFDKIKEIINPKIVYKEVVETVSSTERKFIKIFQEYQNKIYKKDDYKNGKSDRYESYQQIS